MPEEKKNLVHNVILEGRKKLSISGVQDVDSFDENLIEIYTEMGAMDVKGAELHICNLSLESGEFVVEGEIDSISYQDKSAGEEKERFFKRLFK